MPFYEQLFCKALLRQEFAYREMAERYHLPVTNPMQFVSRPESTSESSEMVASQSALGRSPASTRKSSDVVSGVRQSATPATQLASQLAATPKLMRFAAVVRAAVGTLDDDDDVLQLPPLRTPTGFSVSGSSVANRRYGSAKGEPAYRLAAFEGLTPSAPREFLDLLLTEHQRCQLLLQRSSESDFLGSAEVQYCTSERSRCAARLLVTVSKLYKVLCSVRATLQSFGLLLFRGRASASTTWSACNT